MDLLKDDLTNDERANIALAVLWPISTIVLGLRIWIKAFRLRSFGMDDAMMIAAWVSWCVFALALYLESTVPDESGIENAQKSVTLTTISNAFYPVTSAFLKASIGLFFLRLVTDKKSTYFVWAMITFSTLNNIAQMFFVILICGNPIHFWDHALAGTCLDGFQIAAAWYEQAAVNSFVDFAFVLLPIYILWNTTKSRKTRVAISIVLLLATAGSIFSVIRMPFIGTILKPHTGDALEAVDLWSTLELGMGIIAACLPMLSSMSKSWSQSLRKRTAQARLAVRLPHGRWRWQKPSAERQELTIETFLTKVDNMA